MRGRRIVLCRCEMNLVRAGLVKSPEEWAFRGEIFRMKCCGGSPCSALSSLKPSGQVGTGSCTSSFPDALRTWQSVISRITSKSLRPNTRLFKVTYVPDFFSRKQDSTVEFGESLRPPAGQPSLRGRWEQSFRILPKRGENSSKARLHPSCLECRLVRDPRLSSDTVPR